MFYLRMGGGGGGGGVATPQHTRGVLRVFIISNYDETSDEQYRFELIREYDSTL